MVRTKRRGYRKERRGHRSSRILCSSKRIGRKCVFANILQEKIFTHIHHLRINLADHNKPFTMAQLRSSYL